jgi:hypothetical protein
MRSGRNDRERLEQEIQGTEYQALLQELQRRHHFLRQFCTWCEIIAYMRKGTSQDPQKDQVLRPIFQAHAEDQDPRWRMILLTIFWPGLESIHFKKYRWDPVYPDELWSNIVWTFIQVVCRLDVKQRPARLVQKIYNDTVHHLHDEYRRIWNRAEREKSVEQEDIQSLIEKRELEALAGKNECINFATLALQEAREIEIKRLRAHRDAGRISDADFLLLVGTRVYGRPIVDYARDIGLNYQLVKKRWQRAEAAIRRFEEKDR